LGQGFIVKLPIDGCIFTRDRNIINPAGDPGADLDATIIGRVSKFGVEEC